MPIQCQLDIKRLTRDEFIERDRLVMRCAFATQNRLGRFCDERVYENRLAELLRASGMQGVRTQVPIRITHGEFTKVYRIDLVADDAVYELKTVAELIGAHDAQAFHYAMLLDNFCIKLLNFRNAKVEGKLRISPIKKQIRYAYSINAHQWQPISRQCDQLKEHFCEIMSDFGAFLDTNLYEEALITLVPATVVRLPLSCDGHELGTHSVNLISEQVAFCVTAFTSSLDQQRTHLLRLLACLPLVGLHWINLNHSEITLTTLFR